MELMEPEHVRGLPQAKRMNRVRVSDNVSLMNAVLHAMFDGTSLRRDGSRRARGGVCTSATRFWRTSRSAGAYMSIGLCEKNPGVRGDRTTEFRWYRDVRRTRNVPRNFPNVCVIDAFISHRHEAHTFLPEWDGREQSKEVRFVVCVRELEGTRVPSTCVSMMKLHAQRRRDWNDDTHMDTRTSVITRFSQ